MGGDGHDGAGAVATEDVVGDVDWNFFIIGRVGRGNTLKLHPRFFLGVIAAFYIVFLFSYFYIRFNVRPVLNLIFVFFYKGMLRSEN